MGRRKHKKRQDSALVAQWDAKVASFIQENRPLLGDPNLGRIAALTLVAEITELLTELYNEETAKAEEATDAANRLAEALMASGGPAVKARRLRYDRLKAEHERLSAIEERLEAFEAEVRGAVDEA